MTACCDGCTCGHHPKPLPYGPIGDPESRDPFERAQAQAPAGWHVEGQMFGSLMFATTKAGDKLRADGGPEELVQAMIAAGPR